MRRTRSLVRCVALVSFVGSLAVAGCTYTPYSPPPVAFSGDSTAARETVIVPTLDTPSPKGNNVIWCGTFQLCWQELKPIIEPIIGQIEVPQAKDVVRRLDAAGPSAGDMPIGSYHAAGLLKDGILEKIRSDMARRFPRVSPNLPPADDDGDLGVAIAYAYLSDTVKFRTAYFDQRNGSEFTDSAGRKTLVSSFGLFDKSREAAVNDTLARQIEILYRREDDSGPGKFVLDLDRKSDPTQLILACVEPKETLAATWRDVQRKVAEWKPADQDERQFGDHDHLTVPNVNYSIRHSFKELETNPLLKTMQIIDFRLDRSGATIASEAFLFCLKGGGGGRPFNFTRPFMIAMRKRGSSEPYFVMWVDNPELLCKQAAD